MKEPGFLKTSIKKISLLFVLFLFIYLVAGLFSYVETRSKCFPITIITVDKKPVEELVQSVNTCSFSVESEKMTFDSSIFNHYETPPVKDIFLFYAEIHIADWPIFSEMDNAISEANPFLLEIVSKYSSSKLKIFLLAYISLFFFGLMFLLRVAPSRKEPHYNYKKTSIFTVLVFSTFSVPAFFMFNSNILLFAVFVLATLFIAYLAIVLLVHRLLFFGDKK